MIEMRTPLSLHTDTMESIYIQSPEMRYIVDPKRGHLCIEWSLTS